jgi:hypothetical protein
MHNLQIDFSDSFKNRKIVNFEIPSNQIIGIMLSGGADSALLYWLLLRENINNHLGNVIIPFCVDRQNGAVYHSTKVIRYLEQYFQISIPELIVVGDPDTHHSKHIHSGLVDIKKIYGINTVYVGGTQNPPMGSVNGEYPLRSLNHRRFDINPFLHCDKSHIIFLYLRYKLLGLLDITHSCGSLKDGKCMKCFSCNERAWAISQVMKLHG